MNMERPRTGPRSGVEAPDIPDDAMAILEQRPGVAGTVADALAEMILRGSLAPDTRLVQTKLVEWFQVSRVAIRDALALLDRTGLVEQRGASVFVQDISIASMREVFEIRSALEALASRKACQKMSEAEFRELAGILASQERIVRDGDIEQFPAVDEQFHKHIHAHSGNALLTVYLAPLELRVKHAVNLAQQHSGGAFDGAEWTMRSFGRHRRILEALRTGDAEVAGAATIECMREDADGLIEALRRILGKAGSVGGIIRQDAAVSEE